MIQWTEKLRPCAEALYIVLFHNHSELLGPLVVSILQEAITPGLLLKDAAYAAAAYVYYELSNYMTFKDWFNGALSLDLSNDHPNMRIIHRKVAIILGQWVSEVIYLFDFSYFKNIMDSKELYKHIEVSSQYMSSGGRCKEFFSVAMFLASLLLISYSHLRYLTVFLVSKLGEINFFVFV
ncbi:uncharacterized protein LOC133824790 [Humulus lupulus]|uniref:uncharacterized protein LOC133824790 n=1 Tax=Humulus lupulus TaxID=3486 RepID=UPI002B416EF9|nr:uncharacterized protein LOC133824790 [Humulus lupulus]